MTEDPPGPDALRVAIVTGGAFNIGQAVATSLAASGVKVAIASRNTANVAAAVSSIESAGGTAIGVPTDVTDHAQVEHLVAETGDRLGPVDLVAAFAGGGGAEKPIDEVDPAAWSDVVTRNLVGTFHTARAVLPGMRQRNRGVILTCAGGGAFFPVPDQAMTAYAASKAAVCRFTDQLQAELLDTAIRVNCIEPGQVAVGDRESAHRVAGLVHFLASPAARSVRGRLVSVNDEWWRDPEQVAAVAQSHSACRLWRASHR